MKPGVIKWAVVGDIFVVHTTEGRIPDAQWNAFVQEIRARPVRRFLGASTGATEVPSTQRKLVTEALAEKKITSLVITDDRVVRGLATAASWFGVNIQSFAWSELDKVMKELKAGPEQARELTATLMRLKTASLAELG